jgi:hypothetical protein
MSEKQIDKMVRFVYWKLGKPGRLATQSAVKEAKRAAQEILDAGYSPFNVMEMFTFLDDEPDVQASGFDESMAWWRNQISDLPSLAVVLRRPAPNRFVAQYEKRSAEMKNFRKARGYSTQAWINEMTLPRKDDPDYEGKVFELLLKNPDEYMANSSEIKKGFEDNIALRDRIWAALVPSYEGNPEPLYALLRAELTPAGLKVVFEAEDGVLLNAQACATSRLAHVETLIPYKYRLPEPQTAAEKEIMKLMGLFYKMDEIAKEHGMHNRFA